MNTNETLTIQNESIEQLMEKIRSSFAYMLNEHLWVYKKNDQLRSTIQDEKMKNYFILDGHSYYNENGKINWEIIRRFMPQDLERGLKEQYSMLNENEVRLCCLLFFKVSKKSISTILPYNQNSIKSITCRIRQKAGIETITEIYRLIVKKLAWEKSQRSVDYLFNYSAFNLLDKWYL